MILKEIYEKFRDWRLASQCCHQKNHKSQLWQMERTQEGVSTIPSLSQPRSE